MTNWFDRIGVVEIKVEACELRTGDELMIIGKTTGILEMTVDDMRVDFAQVDVSGKIALVSRGEITFVEKAANAENAGAVACVVFNNQAGNVNMANSTSTERLPSRMAECVMSR